MMVICMCVLMMCHACVLMTRVGDEWAVYTIYPPCCPNHPLINTRSPPTPTPHPQELINPSPATLTQTVSGSKSTTRAVTMSFTNTVTNSFTIAEKVTVKAGIPSVADVSSETQVTDGFTFQFAVSSSASTSVQKTLTQTIAVNVPAFTHIKVSMLLASQEDVTIPFTATVCWCVGGVVWGALLYGVGVCTCMDVCVFFILVF